MKIELELSDVLLIKKALFKSLREIGDVHYFEWDWPIKEQTKRLLSLLDDVTASELNEQVDDKWAYSDGYLGNPDEIKEGTGNCSCDCGYKEEQIDPLSPDG